MSVDEPTQPGDSSGPAPIVFIPQERRRHLRFGRRRNRPPRPRIRKLRLLFVLVAFAALALISTAFGVLTSVASDLPALNNSAQFKSTVDSYLYDDTGQPIGVLAPPNKTVLDGYRQIAPNMVNAIISVEDKRFWTDPGIDIKGLLRAAASDITGGPKEGASTIAEEFVKNVEAEQDNRTIFEKLREAALAFQLTHKWRRTKIMDEYLNTIYFGNGAYGIESAARVYFGRAHGYRPGSPTETNSDCGDPDAQDEHRPTCASELRPWESALLAGMVANPTEFDPILHPAQAEGRRNLVLRDMMEQHYITPAQYQIYRRKPLPKATDIQEPSEPAAAPYFTAWVRPQIVRALEKSEHLSPSAAQYKAYYGGLKIKLTINLAMQDAAQRVVDDVLQNSGGLSASLVAIDNRTGEVRAMVSGDGNYSASPFNLATLGYRQPGSSFKMFTLAAALSSGEYSPYSTIDSKPLSIRYRETNGRIGVFNVHNFGNVYAGPTTLATATATSDNSVFTQIGMAMGTVKVKHYARLMGIRSPISTTPAMILGGLNTGVSALDMAHAYETAATGGYKIYNPTLGDIEQGPIGIHSIFCPKNCKIKSIVNRPQKKYVLSPEVASEIHQLLEGPVHDSYGTGTNADIPGVDVVGKTGTTSNYVDAWFVGYTPQTTVAVWVGYPDSAKPMTTNYNGGPVEGGDYPAIIWRDFVEDSIQIQTEEQDAKASHGSSTPLTTPVGSSTSATQAPTYTSSTLTSTTSQTTASQSQTQTSQTTATAPAVNTATSQQSVTAPPATGVTTSATTVTPTASSTSPVAPPATAPVDQTTAPATTETPTSTSGGAGIGAP
jgi:penicillin-binding protein 1A